MPQKGIGRSGEGRAGEIPSLARMDDQLVPGDPAGPWLVRVGDEPRRAVGRAPRRYRHGVRTVRARIAAERRVGSRHDLAGDVDRRSALAPERPARSEEHTSELQSLMRISYAVFCFK